MSPIAIPETQAVELPDIKTKVVNHEVEVEITTKPPVDDNYMYDFRYNHALPTIDEFHHDIPTDIDADRTAQDFLDKLEIALGAEDAVAFADLFLEHGVWRDKLTFTWDYRTYNFRENISRAAPALLPGKQCRNFKLHRPAPTVNRPYPDLAYLQFVFTFDTAKIHSSGVLNAVLTAEGWKIWTLHTVAEGLLDFPELPPQDGHMTGSISWERQRVLDDDSVEPEVLVIGGGQNGLAISANLMALGVQTLIIEKQEKIGMIWRDRYEYLSLHFPHWADHFPYFPFPDRWPTYTPAQKLGIFMEWYAHALELPVWTQSNVLSATQDDDGIWTVAVSKQGKERVLRPKHIIMATSLCGMPLMPVIPGMSGFKGVIRHSTEHDSSRDWVGKKVLVVGTSSSGFDTAYDCARRDIDVTLLQRSPTYIMSLTHSVPRMIGIFEPKNGVRPNIDDMDRIFHAIPIGPAEELSRRTAKVLEDLDRELLDKLHARGLRTWRGQRNTGNATLGQTRNGGFYFDAGACEQIINGKIRVEQGFVEAFTSDSVILSGGRERKYDLVVFATGFSNAVDSIRAVLRDDVAKRLGPIWGIDEEGEFKSVYKASGVPGLWVMAGYLPYTRYHAKRLALRIKASLEGLI